jgi:hypothetical protein
MENAVLIGLSPPVRTVKTWENSIDEQACRCLMQGVGKRVVGKNRNSDNWVIKRLSLKRPPDVR